MEQPVFPPEIVSEILVWTDDFILACRIGDEYSTNKLYDENKEECTWTWAARNGCFSIIKWLYTNKKKGYHGQIASEAAKNGHLEIVEFLFYRTDIHIIKTLECAARNGHLECVEFIYANRGNYYIMSVMTEAARGGHLDIVKFFYEKGGERYIDDGINCAAGNGYLKIVKFLYEKGARCSTDAMDYASCNGHLETVKFLHEKGTGCTTQAMDLAARNGHLEVLKFLNENRTERYTSRAIDLAAKNGHTECVKFLYAMTIEYLKFQVIKGVSNWGIDEKQEIEQWISQQK